MDAVTKANAALAEWIGTLPGITEAVLADTGGNCEAIIATRTDGAQLIITDGDAQLPMAGDNRLGYGLYVGPDDDGTAEPIVWMQDVNRYAWPLHMIHQTIASAVAEWTKTEEI